MAADQTTTTAPVWLGLRAAGQSFDPPKSPRLLAREIRAGRLRAAQIGGRGEFVTCQAWIREWVEQQARPIEVGFRRRA